MRIPGGIQDDKRLSRGFTLIEALAVVTVLAVLASLVLPTFENAEDSARASATNVTMQNLRNFIMGLNGQPGYYGDMRYVAGFSPLPQKLSDLFTVPRDLSNIPAPAYDPNTKKGWRGPYVQNDSGKYKIDAAKNFISAYGDDGDPSLVDGWNHPIVIQRPTVGTSDEQSLFTRLVSAGADGVITTRADMLYPLRTDRGDDVVLFLRRSDVAP